MSPKPAQHAAGTELPKAYKPAEHEGRVRARWDESNAFHADPARVDRDALPTHTPGAMRPPYAVVIPPPNVTAALHLGHALNNTLQDVLVRAHRMMGYETIWLPGTDHAGIATQTVVEKRLLKDEGKRRTDYARDEFVAKVQAFKDEYEAVITDQLKRMGCSCDWSRQRFTMDDVCARAVREAFFRLFKDGLIYRGKRLVNWDPVTQTALADDEVEMEEVDGFFYYLKYPLCDAAGAPLRVRLPDGETDHVTVATTRPETYLGDTAVAMNPKDPRWPALRDAGAHARLPFVGRVVPILADDYVVLPAHMQANPEDAAKDPKAQYATGFLKVTPAHDVNDYEIGRRHGLPVINVMAPDASISDMHGWADIGDARPFVGLTREDARKAVVKAFEGEGLLEGKKPYRHSVGHSYRSHAPIEPYLSDQWYVKVTDARLAGFAQRALASDQRTSSLPTPSSGTGVPPVSTPSTSSSSPSHTSSYSSTPPSFTNAPGIPESLTIHRRNLPHWQMGRRTYFITFRLLSGRLTDDERRVVLDACAHWHGVRARVHLITVMPDHVHMIVTPLEKSPGEWWPLQELIHSAKSFSAHEIQKRRGDAGAVWQTEYFDRLLRDADEFVEKWNYMMMNPVKARLCEQPREYPFTVSPERDEERKIRGEEVGDEEGEKDVEGVEDGRDARPTSWGSEERRGDGSLRFVPARYAKTYSTWHENIRDWCISRQLWWGHRIPVWHIQLNYSATYDPSDASALQEHEIKKLEIHNSALERLHAFMQAVGAADDYDIKEAIFSKWYVSVSSSRAATALHHFCEFHNNSKLHVVEPGQPFHEFPSTFPEFPNAYDAACDLVLSVHSIKQDPDVLDTWFSSALWPLSTMGWPQPGQSNQTDALLGAFNPTDALCTAREIITLWVSRMVMFNRYFLGEEKASRHQGIEASSRKDAASGEGHSRIPGPPPFRDVFIHAMIQDGEGRKMSKSLGNGVDPLDIIETHGADAMRYTLCHMTTQTQDVRMPVARDEATGKNTSPKFDLGRNFCNKLWNAARFAISILEDAPHPGPLSAGEGEERPLVDRWMLSRLSAAVSDVSAALKNYEFSVYAQSVYDLLWRDFCDWYLEAIKPTVRESAGQRAALRASLDCVLRLLHPICPFITEAVYERVGTLDAPPVPGVDLPPPPPPPDGAGLLCLAPWPVVAESLRDEGAERTFDRLRALISAVREARSLQNVPPKRKITLHLDEANAPDLCSEVRANRIIVESLAGLGAIEFAPPGANAASTPFTIEGREHRLSDLADASDEGAERERLTKKLADLDKSIGALESRLNNPGYADKAPAKLVEQSREQLRAAIAERDATNAALDRLG